MAYLTHEENERRFRYHREGRIDVEIASLCGVTTSAIQEWRINRSLKANKKKSHSKRIYANDFNREIVDRFYET